MFKRISVLAGIVVFSLILVSGLLELSSGAEAAVRASPELQAGCIPVTSDITTTQTWTEACYQVMTSTVTVQPGVVLTILPITSTRVEFDLGSVLLVSGRLQALGAADRPITFTSAVSTTPCAWNGIIVPFGSQGARIEYSTIEYACSGVNIGGPQNIQILSSVFRYNGESDNVRGAAIIGITDYSVISGNVIYSSTNGVFLNKAFNNQIVGNTIHDMHQYGINFTAQLTTGQPTVGGNNNVVANNLISNTTVALRFEIGSSNQVSGNSVYSNSESVRLETGTSNQVLSNSIYSNSVGAIYLAGQGSASVQYNYVYSNGGGTGYPAAIYITGTPNLAVNDVSYNVIHDQYQDAILYTANNGNIGPMMTGNALCSVPAFELQNGSSVSLSAPTNWWGTNTPTSGKEYTGPVNVTPWITLSLITSTADLPADGVSTSVITIALREPSSGATVPPASTRQTDPPAPNPRRIDLATTMGLISPSVVFVGDDGFATATLTSAPATGTATISATAFCNYSVSIPIRFAATNLAIAKTTAVTQVVAGDTLAYRITYSNTSSITANDVHITDTLPVGTIWLSDTAPALGWTRVQTSPQVVYTRTSLSPNLPESFVLTTTVSNVTCGRSLTNTIDIGTRTVEETLDDNRAQDWSARVICADVTITKTTALTQAVPGNVITYTVSYHNAGDASAENSVVTDVLPLNTSYITSSLAPSATGPLTWPVGTLPPHSPVYSFTLTLQVDRNPALCGLSLTNSVSIATTTPESNTTNNSAQAGAISAICADVWISKTTSVTQTVAGGLIPYTITYGNSGLASAENTVITDTLPPGTRYVTSSLPCQTCAQPGPLDWWVDTLPPGSSYSFNLTLQVDPGTTNCNLVVPPNTAIITTTTPETPTLNNMAASPPVTSTCPVDLVVVKDDDVGPSTPLSALLTPEGQSAVDQLLRGARRFDPQAVTQHRDFVYEGDLVTYTIAVVNVGSITGTNIVLTETLPQYTTYVTGSGWLAVAATNYYTLSIGSLSPGDGRIYYFIVRVNDPITASVSSVINHVCGLAAESDANAVDNCSYEDTPVRRQPLRISKWAQCVIPGKDFNYWLVYTNTAMETYSNVQITDTLPMSATYSGDVTDWICAGSLYCVWTAPAIYPGTGVKLLPVRLDRNYPFATVTNTVVISDGKPFTLVTPVDRQPDLAVVKNDNIGPLTLTQQLAWDRIQQQLYGQVQINRAQDNREYARPGERITYTILYVNNGVSPATNVVLTETLPANTTYAGGGWTPVGGRSYIISLGTLGPQQGGQVQFIVKVNDPFPCSSNRVVNRVDIGGAQSECDLTNNWSADHTPISGCTPIQIYLPIILRQTEPTMPVEVAFSRSNYYVWETMGVATITVVLNSPSTQMVTVNYATSDGTATAGLDYIASTGTLTFAPGATSATFTVRVLADTVTETLETVNLTLSNPVNAILGQPNPATLTIVDPCPPTPPDCAPAVWCVIPSEFSPMGMAYDSAAGRLFVANQSGPSGNGNLSIYQNSGLPQGTIDGLISPQGVALDGTRGRNRAYVVGANWLHIVELSATTPYVMATLEVGVGEDVGAYSAAYNPNTDLIYVTGYRDNSVTVINAETWHILRRLTGFHEPSYTAVNTATNKVYISNHTGGNPWGFVSVISGTDKIGTVYLSGDLYGISVDASRNRIYVASISVARVYVIDGRTDTTMGDIQIIRKLDVRPVPLRQTAVNPAVVTDTHLWLTSSSGDFRGMDRLILLSLPQSDWPPSTPLVLRSTPVSASPEGGLVFDPNSASWRVFASSAASNLVTVSRDNANLCPEPLAMSQAGEDGYYVVTHDYTFRRPNR